MSAKPLIFNKMKLDGLHNIGYNYVMLPKIKQERHNRTAKFLIGFVVLMLVAVIAFESNELRVKRDTYAAKEELLQQQIDKEEERAEEIAEYETYTKTKAYVEDIARDKLGLVYKGEILFKDEN